MDIHNATSNIARVSITINPAPEESTIPSPSEQQPSLTEQTPSQGPMTFWFHLTNKHFLDNVAIKATGEISAKITITIVIVLLSNSNEAHFYLTAAPT